MPPPPRKMADEPSAKRIRVTLPGDHHTAPTATPAGAHPAAHTADVDSDSSLEPVIPTIPTMPTVVRFCSEEVAGLINDCNWDGLMEYLHAFLRKVEAEVRSHPGLVLPVYQAFISALIASGNTDEAMTFFQDKVEPLTGEDSTIDSCLQKLKHDITSNVDCSLPQSQVSEAINGYIALHFIDYTKLRFEGEVVQELLELRQWDSIEDYLRALLAAVKSESHSHQGLMCSFFEAYIIYLIEHERYEEAQNIFHVKVKPLDSDEDPLYKPLDLRMRINMLEEIVKERTIPADYARDDILEVIVDYVWLYFEDSIREIDESARNSVKGFTRLLASGKGKRYMCLACRWCTSAVSDIKSCEACWVKPLVLFESNSMDA